MSAYQTTPITKHYALNNQILAAFDSLYEKKVYKLAYAIGMQFVEVALLEIPKHGYFYSARHRLERMENSNNAVRVTRLLQQMLDDEESEIQQVVTQADRIRVEKLQRLAQEQANHNHSSGSSGSHHPKSSSYSSSSSNSNNHTMRYEHDRKAAEQDLLSETSTLGTFCGQVMDYHEIMANICPNQPSPTTATTTTTTTTPKSSKTVSTHRRPSSHDPVPQEIHPPRRRAPAPQPREFEQGQQQQHRVTTGRKKRNYNSPQQQQQQSIQEGWTIVHDATVVDEGAGSGDVRDQPPPPSIQRRSKVGGQTELERALFLSGMVKDYPPSNHGSSSSSLGGSAVSVSVQASQYPRQDSWKGTAFGNELDNVGSVVGGAVTPASAPETSSERRKKSQTTSLDFNSLQLCYAEDFDTLRERSRIRISQADTYQGKLPGSINGCTVIAPLLCIHHLHNWLSSDNNNMVDGGLPDGAIAEVIDLETPAILPEVRSKLGLTKDALIIPSDVHDFLMDKELLSSQQFVTVCGGNILDLGHVDAFVEELSKVAQERKVGATFFFHEHVVAILPLNRRGNNNNISSMSGGGGCLWYDWLDSLPNQQTLRKLDVLEHEFVPNAARIRCLDEEALKATIRWHACSKFTDENRAFIDMYDWDDAHSDFDPRVFQAFIWAEVQ